MIAWLSTLFSIKFLQIIHFRGVLYTTNCADFLFKSKLNNPLSHCSNIMEYSQVPIKQVGPNKRVGWIF